MNTNNKNEKQLFSFFPGCSLKNWGNENTQSLVNFCDKVNIELQELDDWNCCGSSSAHSVDKKVAKYLPMRNIALIPKGRPLLIACPSCLLRIKSTWLKIKSDPAVREDYESFFNKAFDEDIEIIHFFEIFDRISSDVTMDALKHRLNGLKVAPYYGCMLSMPPDMRFEKSHAGIMENNLEPLGAEIIPFGYSTRCCGTYLSVAKPAIAIKVINEIVSKAAQAGAECLVTACSMCHLNLEIRCTLEKPIPIFHFSELLAFDIGMGKKWFPRHIVDPIPLLKERGLYDTSA
jgi:heterodisulfide reductase subunit B2